MAGIDAANKERLRHVSTATLTTALFKRGFRNCFMHGPRRINPKGRQMVGEAYTMRYIPAREDLDKSSTCFGTRRTRSERASNPARPAMYSSSTRAATRARHRPAASW